MTASAISVRDLVKSYRIYDRPSQMFAEAIGLGRRHRVFTALDGVSFDVAPGEVIGVMGRNGAGKSTLLRIVAGTLEPTAGVVDVRGRVSAILELGSGFHPDYTGRDNVYLGGLCMGLSRAEVEAKFDEIVAFAELEKFIDRPFRTYSSGMQARLTFAVATSVDPDVLIIDEALAVGDARFAVKSFDRIRDFKARGKAILFVSHSINQVISICDRAILLEHGRVVAQGEPNQVGSIYHELLFGVASETQSASDAPLADTLVSPATQTWESMLGRSPGEHRYGDERMIFSKAAILTPDGRAVGALESGSKYILRVEITAREEIEDYWFGVLVRDSRGLELYGLDTLKFSPEVRMPVLAPGESFTFDMAFDANLGAGTYFVTLGLARSDEHKYDMRFDAFEFVVAPTPHLFHSSLVNLHAEFNGIDTAGRRLARVSAHALEERT